MDLAALKAELTAGHPVTGAYSGDHAGAAAELNAENRERQKDTLTGDELFTATDGPEFAALSDVKKQLWVSWCNTHRDPGDASNVAFVNFVFGAASNTLAALAILRTESISRAVELDFGPVTAGHVQRARAS